MWPFSGKNKGTNGVSYKIYTTTEELPLYIFRECLKGGDLTPLVISGKPPVEVVAEAWANIFSQYIDLSGDNDVKAMALLKRDYVLLLDRVSKVEMSLQLLSIGIYTPEQYGKLIDIIKGEGFVFEKNHDTDDSFQNSIKRVKNRLAPIRLKLVGMEKELLEYESAAGTESLPENYFISWLVCLQKFGYRDYTVANKVLTVTEFVLAIKDYLAHIAEHNKQLNYGKEKHD